MPAPQPATVDWVPYDPYRDPAQTESLALRSLLTAASASTESRAPRLSILIARDADSLRRGGGPLAVVARHAQVVTRRTSGGATHRLPTYAPMVPTPEMLCIATELASGSHLVVTEHPAVPLKEWAGIIGARDLVTGEVLPDPRNPEQRTMLEHLVQSGYNGWDAPPGDSSLHYLMPQLADSGMTWATFLAALRVSERRRRVHEPRLLKAAPEIWRAEAAAAAEVDLTSW